MQISFYQEYQLDTVSDLLHDMSVHYNGADASPRAAVRDNLIHNILGRESGVRIVVAEIEGIAAGFATISLLYPAPKEHAQLFMKELYVVAAYRNQGIGAELMRWIARYAVEKRCQRFDWTVDTANTKALAFYAELGALPVADKQYFRLGGDTLLSFASGQDEGASE